RAGPRKTRSCPCSLLEKTLLLPFLLSFLLRLRGRGGSGFTFSGRLLLFLGFLDLLDHDAVNADLRQGVRTPPFLPAFFILQDFDPFAAREHVPSALQRVLAAKAFVNRHG